MRTIYIVNDNQHDFSAANSYGGNFVILTSGLVNIFRSDSIKRDFEEKMKDAQPGDLLLLSGNTILNVLAACILLSKIDSVGFLIYNFSTKRYEKRKYSLADFDLQPRIKEKVQ